MPWNTPWTPYEVQVLKLQYNNCVHPSAIAKIIKRSFASVKNKIGELLADGELVHHEVYGACSKSEPVGVEFQEVNFDDFFKLHGNYICISDAHCPYFHSGLLEKILAIAKKFKVKNCILNGDILNMDAFTHHFSGNHGRDYMEREFKATESYLASLASVFDTLYFLPGNHERRILKQLLGSVKFERAGKMVFENPELQKRVRLSSYSYCSINDGKWKVGHPESYSERGGTTPSDIADAHQCNVITAHNHQIGFQTNRSGQYIGIDQGCACDPKKLEYYSVNFTKGRRWQVGFAMVYDNYGYWFSLNHTDWSLWLKKIKL